MRAFEISMLLIFVLTAPSVIQAMGVVPPVSTTCTTMDCQARTTILNLANSTSLKEVDFAASPGQAAWDLVTLTVTFPIYAFFWMLYFLSLIVFIGPALQSMFGVPAAIATYLNVGVWIIWLIAYIQWKRGGIGIDGYR
jgi:hypothetical protein